MGSFSGYHPAVIFLYFVLILVFTMFSMHPYFLCCSLLCGFLCSFLWGQGKAIKRNLRMTVPLVMLGIVINPLFTQRGSTILFYLNDAAVTLEAVLYGLAAAMLFSSVLVWIQCWGMVMGIDQFICLFGRVLPVLGLLLSITFRMFPLLQRRFDQVKDGQRCMGRDDGSRHPIKKLRIFSKELSILIAWSLEAGIETSDSMEARGYGLKGRSSYTIYQFDRRDLCVLLLILLLGGVVLIGCVEKMNGLLFYPRIVFRKTGWLKIPVYGAFAGLCLLPVVVELLGEWKWRRLYSNM